MSDESKPAPNWDQSDHWDEFEWEKALKHSDHLAGRYFRMLERFGDLPDAWTPAGAAVVGLAGLYILHRETRGRRGW